MSRIGKKTVAVPDGVTTTIDGQQVTAKGAKGELSVLLVDEVMVEMTEDGISVAARQQTNRGRSLWGMSRTIVSNIIVGVSEGYSKKLEINGVGYRAAVQGSKLQLQLGFSHEVNYVIPEGIKIECPTQTEIVVSGIEKQKVGQVAAEIRSYRPPEPYKGKGIKYQGEYIFRKEGKKK